MGREDVVLDFRGGGGDGVGEEDGGRVGLEEGGELRDFEVGVECVSEEGVARGACGAGLDC